MTSIFVPPAETEELQGLEEVLRICRMPAGRDPVPEEVEEVSRLEVSPSFFRGSHPLAAGRPFRLWRQQAQGILAFQTHGGLFVNLKVGGGKEFLIAMCLKHSHLPRSDGGLGIERSLYLLPSDLVGKFRDHDLWKARSIFGLETPVHLLAGLPPRRRATLARSGLPGIYVSTYALLRREEGLTELEALAPGLVALNEAQAVCATSRSATSRRFFLLMKRTRARLVAASGTMAKKTLMSWWPLIVLALRERAPVPVLEAVAQVWGAATEAGAKPSVDVLRSLEPLRQWAFARVADGSIDARDVGGPLSPDAEGMRRAIRVRRNATVGVVSSAEDSLGASLLIQNREPWAEAIHEAGQAIPGEGLEACFDGIVRGVEDRLERDLPRPLPDDFRPHNEFLGLSPFERTVALMWAVRRRWRMPSGDEIEYAIHTYQVLKEIASGFYHEHYWLDAETLSGQRGVPVEDAEEMLAGAKAHEKAHRRFLKRMREFLEAGHTENLDMPFLIWNACARRDPRIPDELYAFYLAVRGAEFEGMPKKLSRTVRVSDWRIRAAVAWARDLVAERGTSAGGLVWCENREIREWAHELFLAEFGPEKVLHCPATPAAAKKIQEADTRDKFVIASIEGHGKGKDLFHFDRQVFLQVERNAGSMQQLLGRTHRPGQLSDRVEVRTLHALAFDREDWSALLHDAMYNDQAEDPQKVVRADYDPMPMVSPADFLQQRGFGLASLTQDTALRMVLGGSSA